MTLPLTRRAALAGGAALAALLAAAPVRAQDLGRARALVDALVADVLSGDQMARYQAAFSTYVARKYGSRFREFIGGRILVEDARAVPNGIEVQTTADLRGEAPFRVDFWVSDRSGQLKFFNMVIEGVNMLLSERTEIQAMLDQRGGDVERLIADLSRM